MLILKINFKNKKILLQIILNAQVLSKDSHDLRGKYQDSDK
jgi:hypothetical protein